MIFGSVLHRYYISHKIDIFPGKITFFVKFLKLLCRNMPCLFFSKLASGRNPPNPAIWLVPRAGGILQSCPLTQEESLAASVTIFLLFVNEQKLSFSNHIYFNTCAIISISWGKVNFIIQTKSLKGESSKSAMKTAKVKQNEWLVMSLH